MKNIFLFLSILLLAVACGGKRQTVGADGQGGQSGLVVEISDSLISHRKTDTIAFGRVREGEYVVREFTVRNAGDRAMVITSLDLSCGCVAADYPHEPLKPGDEAPMKITLDTRNLSGWVFKTAAMNTSLTSRPYYLCVTADIAAEVE